MLKYNAIIRLGAFALNVPVFTNFNLLNGAN